MGGGSSRQYVTSNVQEDWKGRPPRIVPTSVYSNGSTVTTFFAVRAISADLRRHSLHDIRHEINVSDDT